MKNECSIVRDLLPLYTENMVSTDTKAFVAEHLKNCEACRKEYEQIQEPRPVQKTNEAAPLQNLSRKLKMKRIQTIALTAVFVIALFVSAFAVLGAPIYQPYSEGLVTVEKFGEKGLTLIFDENVTDFRCEVFDVPTEISAACICKIEAWTTLWDKWFSKGRERLSTVIVSTGEPANAYYQPKPMELYYLPNDGGSSICIARYDPNAENQIEIDGKTEGLTALPRLMLGYYLIFASAALVIAVIVWLFTRKEQNVRLWVERVGLYPVAYIVSHCIISGIDWSTYSISRDFSLTIFLSILLYSGLLLAHNIWYLKKEIKTVNR